MTPQELRTLIESDEQANSAFNSEDDSACAARCMVIAAPHVRDTLLGELGIINLYANPVDAETVLQALEGVAQANPVVARVLKWIQPSAPGVNFGDPRVRQMLVSPVEQGGLGLSAELAAPLLTAVEVRQVITELDISNARGI